MLGTLAAVILVVTGVITILTLVALGTVLGGRLGGMVGAAGVGEVLVMAMITAMGMLVRCVLGAGLVGMDLAGLLLLKAPGFKRFLLGLNFSSPVLVMVSA